LDVWNQLFTVVRELNAWTTTLAGWRNMKYGTEDYSYNTVVRGGVAYNVTSRKSLMSLKEYNEAALKAPQLRHSFDEYLIVSDGAAASASSIFSSAVEQIWKNRDRSGADARVTTVSFGGTGDKADLTMAGVPASVEDVRLDNSLYTTILLLLFPMLLPVTIGNLNEMFDYLLDVARFVDGDTYSPPYFAQELPRIPVQNYYDPFMDRGALPLQYIEMQPDEYIRQFFIGTTFNDDYDLASLYFEASAFFLQSTGDSTPLPTSTPTQAPTIDPTSNPTAATQAPTIDPTSNPTSTPTQAPTIDPTSNPTAATQAPNIDPTSNPTAANVSGPTNPPSVSPSVTQQPPPGGASNSNPDSKPNKDDSGVLDPLCEEHVAIANFNNDGALDPGEFVTLVNLIAEDQIAISFQDLPQVFQDMFDKWTSDTVDIRSNVFRHGGFGLQTICSETTALVDALLAGTIPSQLPTSPALTPSTAPTSSEMLIEIWDSNEETAVNSDANRNLRLTIGLTLDVCFVIVLVLAEI